MTGLITLKKIEISGFRAYCEPQTIKLHVKGPRSLAVFAPNGYGKSSLVDSLEYYFSKVGTLELLGKSSTPNRGGINALRNVNATKSGIKTYVRIWFKREGMEDFDDQRLILTPPPKSANDVMELTKVKFVIRGYKLRGFVDSVKPTDMYKELVTWIDHKPLSDAQDNLKKLKREVGNMVNDQSDVRERSRDIKRITSSSISSYDEQAILDWLNRSILATLDESLRFESLSREDPMFLELTRREKVEQGRSGLDVLNRMLNAVDNLHKPPGTTEEQIGRIPFFEDAILKFRDKEAKAKAVEAATDNSKFRDVWHNAKTLLEGNTEIKSCPVCNTKFTSSPLKTHEGVYKYLQAKISTLKQCLDAINAKTSAEGELARAKRDLEEALATVLNLSSSTYEHKAIANYSVVLKSWEIGAETPDSKMAIQELVRLHDVIDAKIKTVEKQQGEHTYRRALDKVNRLLEVKVEMERIKRTKAAQNAIKESLEQQVKAVNAAILKHVRGLLDNLQNETGTLYKEIQGSDATVPQIHINLNDNEQAQLLIDFADSHKGVAPGGYLSDSQIHTLALSLRLTAIKMFNKIVKIIALDDIVTSYDADRRKNIASVLSKRFGDFQIIIVTHDFNFFQLLREHLPQNRWDFKTITGPDNAGPIFGDYKTTNQLIEEKLKNGEDAGNEIRQAEEKWLKRICKEFKTPSYVGQESYTNGELARSLHEFLKSNSLKPPNVPGNANPFILSLQNSILENLSSHYNDDKYKNVSIGELRSRWKEFKYFKKLFLCPNCCHSRFKRPVDLKIPVCKKCETSFNFKDQTSSTA